MRSYRGLRFIIVLSAFGTSSGAAQPFHRVTADATVALRNVGPFNVASEPDKDTQRPLIRAGNQLDLVAFPKCHRHYFRLIHMRFPFLNTGVWGDMSPCSPAAPFRSWIWRCPVRRRV